MVTAAIYVYLPGYEQRPFNMAERVLTESRVLLFYLSLIFIPSLDRLGQHHDDIPISTTLLEPWTTIPSILGIAALITAAVQCRRRYPFLSLGILWFFAGHAIESTILPLEIAHEHRNYLPALGVVLVLTELISRAGVVFRSRSVWAVIPVLVVVFGGITSIRASQWADYERLHQFEAMHHPNSARAQMGLSYLRETQGDYDAAIEAAKRALTLDPRESGYLLYIQVLEQRTDGEASVEVQEETLKRLATDPISATTMYSLNLVANCIESWCARLTNALEEWVRAVLTNPHLPNDRSYYYYLLGKALTNQNRFDDAIAMFERAYGENSEYLHPLFAMAIIYVQRGDAKNAERVLAELERANARSPHPRYRELAVIAAAVARLKQNVPTP